MSSISKPMSQFLRKSIHFGSCSVRALAQTSSVCYSFRWFSVSSSSDKEHSFTVSYLISSLGFSPKAALSASRFVNFDSPEKPDKAIEFLKGYGFTHSQISSVVRGYPRTLTCDVEKIVLPKLEFLASKGISGPELAKRLSVFPGVLKSSLDKQIIPTYEFFRSLFQSDEKTLKAVKRFLNILTHDIEKRVGPNIAILREHGVPHSNVATLILRNPNVIVFESELFRRSVEEVVAMGFNAAKVNFVGAVSAIQQLSKTKWESKLNVYKKWGWSEEEVLKAFQREPKVRVVSEDKISACMDFFTNKMGWRPFDIAKAPAILSMSLEKRLIPRCLVYQHLLSKGLLKKERSLSVLFCTSNMYFLQKFVTCYEKEAPELLKLYEQKTPSFKQTREQSSMRSML